MRSRLRRSLNGGCDWRVVADLKVVETVGSTFIIRKSSGIEWVLLL